MDSLSPQQRHIVRHALDSKITSNLYEIKHLERHLDLIGTHHAPETDRYVKSLIEQNLTLREVIGLIDASVDDILDTT